MKSSLISKRGTTIHCILHLQLPPAECVTHPEVNGLTREQLRQRTRGSGKTVEVKTTVARFMLPDGAVVTVHGRRLNVSGAIDALTETIKELRKGQAERWDITTAMRVMRDKAKSTQLSA
jgi:hypothetical protein